MKIIRLFFLSLLCSHLSLNAQQYIPFPDSASVWSNAFYEQVPWGQTYQYQLLDVVNFCANGEDTTINTSTYTKIIQCPEGLYHGAVRDVNGKVYYVPKDSLTEKIIYDFTVSVGDTIPELYIETYWGQTYTNYIIEQVDSILVNGTYRIFINNAWIEGVGNRQGLFWEPWPNVSQYGVDLICFSKNNEQHYPVYGSTACSMELGLEKQILHSLTVAPNPGNSHVVVSSEGSISSWKVVDLNGKVLAEGTVMNQSQWDLDMSYFKSGTYFLSVIIDGVVQQRLIVRD